MAQYLDDDDYEALDRIDQMVSDIRATADSLTVPDSGTELDQDDEETVGERTASRVVSASITSALCGLQGFQALWAGGEKLQRGTTFGLVHRTALLGACEAFWVIRPDDRESRVRRANASALRQLNDEILSKEDIQTMDRLFQDDREVTDEELEGLRSIRTDLTHAVGGRPPSLTTMFKEVASDLISDEFFADEDVEHFSQVLRSQWRTSSADAHGASWQHRFSDPLAEDQEYDSPVVKRVADLGMVIAKAYTAAGIARYAAHIWEQRAIAD
ncbi:hypothetical protein [Brevibacterium sp. CT2-23B]|uniref:hypothetical protein n=1 Tax=Brevibacterium sp. CT2-23B TaxID=2729630 RepID=UPI001555475A|nr:hypothetical protein [Brevibacterium sp. CT2-23B]